MWACVSQVTHRFVTQSAKEVIAISVRDSEKEMAQRGDDVFV